MPRIHKMLAAVLLFTLLALTLVTPAYAFDGRGGERIVIPVDEVVNDDLYVGATEFVLDGTVNGDVISSGQTITVNGTVNGNLLAAAQSVVINGTVNGDVWAAGSVVSVGAKSRINGDILGAAGSLELRQGATVGRDALLAAGQIMLGANVTRNVQAGTGALEIAGQIGGDVYAAVGEPSQGPSGPSPSMFWGQSTVPVPAVKQGLTIDPAARILGNLEYTQNSDLSFPAGIVQGKITRILPPPSDTQLKRQESPAVKAGIWALGSLRSLITLILLGLFLLWVAPMFLKTLSGHLQAKPWHSLGWGAVAYAGFLFLVLLTLFVMILGAIVFGILTLGGLSATIVWLGILAIFALILGFVLVTSFVAKIVFGMTLGKWILTSAKSPLAEHKFWPMVIGVAITVVVLALLSFPLIPGALGFLLNLAIILFGLGALWLWGRELLRKKPAAAA